MTKASNLPAAQEGKSTQIAKADSFSFESAAGMGLENVTSADMLVPRLTIIQALSPQIKPRDPAFIEGAAIGDIVDVGTGDLFKGSIMFLPVFYRKEYLEWAPRASGQGLVNIHPDASILDQTTRNEKKQPLLPNGNLIAETAQFYGFNLSADRRLCFIPMTSSQLKKARKWITLATSEKLKRADGSEFLAPLFYRAYELGTADESNNEGSWAGWTINRGPALPEIDFDGVPWGSIAAEAMHFRETLIAGKASGDLSNVTEEEAVANSAGGGRTDQEVM